MKKSVRMLVMGVLISAGSVSAQPPLLSDVVPLTVGNNWTYRVDIGFGDPNECMDYDSGTVVLSVLQRISTVDSIRWLMREIRNYTHCSKKVGYPRECGVPKLDSASYEIIEELSGRHRLYRNSGVTEMWRSVFPWSRAFPDSIAVYRFALTDTAGIRTVRIDSWLVPQGYGLGYDFIFKGGVGPVSVIVRRVDDYSYHTLLSQSVTSVLADPTQSMPEFIALEQNYPNPFNPLTTIRYSLPSHRQVTLTVFNTLGQQVAVLQNGEQGGGFHEVKFDASKLSSGVYFYRLRVGDFLATKRLTVVR